MKLDNLVSIIVPVYNTQDYLNNCIDSILNQSYKNIEIILVDDGSTDRSPEICDQYATIDNRVRVIHQQNSGVSSARNKGLEQCKGDYIAFVDSDDTIDKDFIDVLYNGFCESIDMTVCDFDVVKDQHGLDIQNDICKAKRIVLSRAEAVETILYGKLFAGHSCNKMFRKKVLDNIRFCNNIYIYEDMLFVLEYLLKSNNVLYVEKPLYRYYMRDNSASHGKMSDKKMTAFTALDTIEQELKELYNEKFTDAINFNRIRWALYCYTLMTYDKCGRRQYSKKVKQILKTYKKNTQLPFKTKAKVSLILCSPALYYCTLKFAKKIRTFSH